MVVLLVHEGAGGTTLASATTPGTVFGDIVNGVSPDVDAIVSGHTHLAYNHSVPVPGVADRGSRGDRAPGGLGRSVRREPQPVSSSRSTTPPATSRPRPRRSCRSARSRPPVTRPPRPSSTTPTPRPRCSVPVRSARSRPASRGPSSSAAPRTAVASPPWATRSPRSSAGRRTRTIAFMNPGGLRADMLGTGADYPRTVTYKNAADVQPFANTLVTMDLTGASDQEGARAAVAAQRRRPGPGASVPQAGDCPTGSTTPTTRLDPRATGSRGCGSTAVKVLASDTLQGDCQLVPRLRHR